MGYDLFGALLFIALTPLVVLGFIVFWIMTHHERAHIEDNWESYADARTREYFPARGEWPNRTSPGVRWVTDGVVFELTVAGAEAGARTRLSARPRQRVLGSFTLGFEGARLVASEPLADRVLAFEGARRALLAFRQYDNVTLRYRRGRLHLEWPGRESNHARLDEAVRALTTLVTAVDATFEAAGRRLAS